jgi:hypothetical protein
MATSKTQYIFDKDGRLFREDSTLREIRIGDEIARALCQDMSIKIKNVVTHEKWGAHSLCADVGGSCWWTVSMPTLTLRCPFIMKENIWVPQLDNNEEPVTVQEWKAPNDMRLMFLVETRLSSGRVSKQNYTYLFAVSQDNNFWRLPLGNLFDECRVCLGNEEYFGLTHLEVVAKALEQLNNASWNADLWNTDKRNKTHALFRYKPLDKGFEQMPVSDDHHWTTYCYKIGLTLTEKVVL